MMSGWSFYNIIFIYILLGYLHMVQVESVFPKIQPVYTDSYLPAAVQVTQHLIDKIDEVSYKTPGVEPTTSTTTDVSPTATYNTLPMTTTINVPPTTDPSLPTTTNLPATTTNVSPPTIINTPPVTTTNIPPVTGTILSTVIDKFPLTLNASSSTPTNVSPITIRITVSTVTNEPPKTNILLSQPDSILMAVTEVPSPSMESSSHPSCRFSLLETTKLQVGSAANYYNTRTVDTELNHEYSLINGTVDEHLIESVLKKNATDKVSIVTNTGIHNNETIRYTIASIVLSRLRDILAVEAKSQGMSKIQGYSTALLKLLVPTSKMSSSDQISFILINMLRNRNVKRRQSIAQTRIVLESLKRKQSSLSTVLTQIPAFQYT